jgi:hypothetical protein
LLSPPRLIAFLLALACIAPAAASASLKLTVGAAEDEARTADPVIAQEKMDLAKSAGFSAIRVTVIWSPGQTAVPDEQLDALRTAAAAALFDGITLMATVMPFGSRTTPLTAAARHQFASFAADLVRRVPNIPSLIIGNEPNINRYWLPQFNPDGSDAAAPAYEALLAQTYDAVKAVNRKEVVIGGSVSPRGSDNPALSRPTHSPTRFITDLGDAYRASGRTKPIMDAFAFHPYGQNSSVPPDTPHPNSTTIGLADYDRLVELLGLAFDGTAQLGTKLPIIYDEYGIESAVPAGKARLYHGREIPAVKAVPVTIQAKYYDEALSMAACQPNVRAMFLFHVSDESDLDRWQSGVYYADGTAKPARAAVRQAIRQIRAGKIDCTATENPDDGWVLVPDVPTNAQKPSNGKPPAEAVGVWKLIEASGVVSGGRNPHP